MTEASADRSVLRVASLSGIVGVMQLATGLVRVKVFALILGPSLLGYLGILNNYMQIVGSCATLGLGSVAIKQIGDMSGSREAMFAAAARLVRLGLAFATAAAVISLAAAPWIPSLISARPFDIAMLSAGIAAIVLSTVIIGVFYGLVLTKDYVISTCAGVLLGTLAAVFAVYWKGGDGVVWAVILVPVTAAIIQLVFVAMRGLVFPKSNTAAASIKPAFSELPNAVKLGLPITLLLLIQTGTILIIRQLVIAESGEVENGMFHASWALAGTINSLLISAIDGDFLRRLSQVALKPAQMADVMHKQIELVVPLLAVVVAGGIAFTDQATMILLSHEFLPAVAAIQIMIASEFFRGIASVYGKTPFALGRSWLALIPDFVAAIVLVVSAYLLVPVWGAAGAATAFLISRSVLLVIAIGISTRMIGEPIPLRQIALIALAGIGILSIFAASEFNHLAGYVIGAICAIYGAFLIKSHFHAR